MSKKRGKKKIVNDQLSIINHSRENGQMPNGKSKKLAVKVLPKGKNKDNQEEISAPASQMNRPQSNGESAEQRQRLIMRVGISCIMAAFFAIWIFNLKHEFNRAGTGKNAGFDWSQARTELDKTMKQVKRSLTEIKQIQQTAQNILAKPAGLTPERLDLLKSKLTSEAASGTASSTKE